MSLPTVTLRCPSCGRLLVAPTPPSSAAAWFACPHCARPVPAVAPRDPPPLFTWEVFPQLYPPAGYPRAPGTGFRTLVVAALVTATVLLVGVGGALLYDGAVALGPSHYTLTGTVEVPSQPNGGGPLVPVPGALVNLTGENGFSEVTTTDSGGHYQLTGVPGGGVQINVSAPGYRPTIVGLFVSPTYDSPGTGPAGMQVVLSYGGTGSTSTIVETPFPDLETFVASLWSSTILLAATAVLTAIGAFLVARERRPAVGAAAGFAAAAAPASVFVLGVTVAYPVIGFVAGATIAVGALAATLQGLFLAWIGSADRAP